MLSAQLLAALLVSFAARDENVLFPKRTARPRGAFVPWPLFPSVTLTLPEVDRETLGNQHQNTLTAMRQ